MKVMAKMSFLLAWWAILGLASMSTLVKGEACTVFANNSCVCKLANGQGLDLQEIQSTFSTWFPASDDFEYAWSPCGNHLNYDRACARSSGSAVCQGPTNVYSLGKESSATYNVDTSKDPVMTILTYTGGDEDRRVEITLICRNQSDTIIYDQQKPALTYRFTYTGKKACLVSIPSGSTPSGSGSLKDISSGSILIIVFVCVVVAYFVFGVGYMFGKHKAKGTDLIPNKDFWLGLPGYIKREHSAISPCRGGSGSSGKEYDKL